MKAMIDDLENNVLGTKFFSATTFVADGIDNKDAQGRIVTLPSEDGEDIMKIEKLYHMKRKEIMRSVHRPNAFGQTESQIDFFCDASKVVINMHPTPCWTYYDNVTPDLSIIIRHDPFLSYEQLDGIFESHLL